MTPHDPSCLTILQGRPAMIHRGRLHLVAPELWYVKILVWLLAGLAFGLPVVLWVGIGP